MTDAPIPPVLGVDDLGPDTQPVAYEVTDGTSWWIVRRPPLGHVQATAHDMGRVCPVIRTGPLPLPWPYSTVRPFRRGSGP